MRIFVKRLAIAVATTSCMLQSGSALAIGLLKAYEAALQNDPIYRSAGHENEAGNEYAAIGRSSLLPNVSANYSTSKNRTDITQPNFFGVPVTTQPAYTSKSGSVNLRQPIYSPEALARYHQGVAQTAYSAAQFSGQEHDLVLRLVGAYFDALFADDQLALVSAQRDTFAEQKRVNDRMFSKGEGTKTDMLETQAKLDLAEAQWIEAQDNRIAARGALSSIVGSEVLTLDAMSSNFSIGSMQPISYEEWKALALVRNAELSAQRYAIQAAEQEVYKSRAGHQPRLDFVAAYSKNDAETISTYKQNSIARSMGIQLNMPLYSGGYVNATYRQAVANRERAKSDLETKTSKVLLELRKQYNFLLSSVGRIDALVKAVDSGRLLVTATTQSVKGGVRINLDVLNAQQQLYSVQRDLAQARYSYLLGYLRLRATAGTLSAEDVNRLAGYFSAGS